MKKYGAFSPLSITAFFLIFCLAHLGCGRSVERTAVKKAAPPPGATMATSFKMARHNLSMAKKLRTLPPSEYILGPEDKVEIIVFGHDEMKMEATISATGRISYYLIGDLQAEGLTQFQLRDKIQEKLAEFIKNPRVVVRITDHRSHKICVLGQVRNPGVYRMRSGFTLLEAISSAGGITSDAYLGGAYLVRDGKILLVNFFELIKKGNMEENVHLVADDVIYVPDNRDQKVFVLGEVNRQTAIPIRDRMTLLEAIAEAGGFTRDANKESVVVMRGNLSEPEIMKIDARHFAANIPLKHGDILYVGSSTFADVERFAVRLSNILDPLLKVGRGIIVWDAASDVISGDKDRRTKIIVSD